MRIAVKTQGITLVELIVTLCIITVTTTIAIPAFNALIANNSVTAYTNELLGALAFARNEAAMRGRQVVICKSSTGTNCAAATSGSWEQGWTIFVDKDNNAALSSSELPPLRIHGPLAGNTTITGNTPVKTYVSYSSDGSAHYTSGGFQAGTLSICHNQGYAKNAIVISTTGRARTNKASANCL